MLVFQTLHVHAMYHCCLENISQKSNENIVLVIVSM